MNKVHDSVRALPEFFDDLELLIFILVVIGRKEGDSIAFEQGPFAHDVPWGEYILDFRLFVRGGDVASGRVEDMGGNVMFVNGVVIRGGGG
jgi:hypothetical protein